MNNEQYEKDLMTCVHCGLCLNACPTYLETGSEADSPRGRIVLMRGLHEGKLSPRDADVAKHLDLCLGCRACESACPSGVPYGNLIEVARERLNAARVRPAATDLSRKALLSALASPKKMTIAMRVAQRTTGGDVPAPVARLLSGSVSATDQTVALPERIAPPLPPAVTPAVGKKRFRVGMLSGCVMRVLYGDVNADTVRVLAANGGEVLVNRRQACCGALHLHNGYAGDAKPMARALIDAFWPWDGLDAIIVNSAGCGSTMKEYEHLLADDPAYAEKAAQFAAKVRDISEWLDEVGWVAPLGPLSDLPVTMTYHDACHLVHGQQIRDAPRALLARIPGVTLVPLPESEICCGSAGIYNFTEPDMAKRLQARKLEHILETGASIVATGNPGCLAWIQSGLKARALPEIRVAHPVTLLAESLCRRQIGSLIGQGTHFEFGTITGYSTMILRKDRKIVWLALIRAVITTIWLSLGWMHTCFAYAVCVGSIVVAPSDATREIKSKADIVCTGKQDEASLMASITRARKYPVKMDMNPGEQKTVLCYGRHSVIWLPGTYHLDSTLTIPDAADLVIQSEGAYFLYGKSTGDAIVITGMNRCRYYFGTVDSASSGAALRIRPTHNMPALMSQVTFTGLVGHGQKGIGLCLDASEENVCVNKFNGTDIAGFDTGVLVGGTNPEVSGPANHTRGLSASVSTARKCDTNFYWFNYIRMCNTDIDERGSGVDDGFWQVNVDASIPNSVAIRTAGRYGKWYVIMGTWNLTGTKALILQPGAAENVIEVHPPIKDYAWEDNSGNKTNKILSPGQPHV